jgi:NADH:ubiquinone oxidoreductase subunit F (NADH-binding)/NADH:ubiquinone oxidoreductase subunit E/Pyruvate/2-oxoacid:ferredoxin oxidoreductase delta subunit
VEDKKSIECKCEGVSVEEINSAVNEIVIRTGRESDKLILILQEVQKKFNYLPSDALKQICRVTEITPGQLSGVATFYSQFRHIPSGQNIIKICIGTACHVKGSGLVTDAFRRYLKMGDETSTSSDNLFSIEEVACLGCCTLAPVVQINDITYGHVKPTQAEGIINSFLSANSKVSQLPAPLTVKDTETEIRVGLGSCCVAGGSKEILAEVEEIRHKYDLDVKIRSVGCVGVCNQTPLMEIVTKDRKQKRYTNVRRDQVEEIILDNLVPGTFAKKIKYRINDLIDTFISDDKLKSPVNVPGEIRERHLFNFLNGQFHIATKNSGILTPDSFDDYLRFEGFSSFKQCLHKLIPEEVINIIKESGLRGRGGAGFLTGAKWEGSSMANGPVKYVVCNGDEGDPGAFMDRMLLESFPFRIIEGMLIAGYATGARKGIFYIRAEYPLAVSRVRSAIEKCYEKGILGHKIDGTSFTFDINIFEGAGAFVCGEETALIASLEGKRGMPRLRPPYPVIKGYKNLPTLVNNVETLAAVPWIIRNGAEKFRSIGTPKSTGTKVFALAGKIARGGLIEVPMGITIRTIVEKIGDGVAGGRKFKAVQIGGPSGGCIPERLADTPIDFDELRELGAMMGSGGMVVLDDTDCMVDIAKYFLLFTHKQSCGKCTFCRVGTKKMLNILTRLCDGEATLAEIDELEKLSYTVRDGSLCGLGNTAPNPVISGIKYFREEYEAHTKGICPSGKCKNLIRYRINDDCTGCTKCAQECPVDAIAFRPYEKHEIDDSICTKCDNCRIVCPEGAVEIIGKNA